MGGSVKLKIRKYPLITVKNVKMAFPIVKKIKIVQEPQKQTF